MLETIAMIERLEDERYAAMLAKDVEALDRLLHDDLVYMHSSGVADTKASYIAGVRDRVWDYRRIDRSEQTIRVHETLALVFNRLSISIAVRGEPKELDNWALAVWVPSGGSWQLLALQSGAIPMPTRVADDHDSTLPLRRRAGPGGVRRRDTPPSARGGQRLDLRRVLVLSTPNHAAQGEQLATLLGTRSVGTFAKATMHTPVEVTDDALAIVRGRQADGVLAVGGGSTIGLGKAIAFRTDLPQIVVSTTYAGSEMTDVLGETSGGVKTTQKNPRIRPEVVVYDVDLTLSLPGPPISGMSPPEPRRFMAPGFANTVSVRWVWPCITSSATCLASPSTCLTRKHTPFFSRTPWLTTPRRHRMPSSVDKRRAGIPPGSGRNRRVSRRKVADTWDPSRRRRDPPCVAFLRANNAVGPIPAGSRHGAYSHPMWHYVSARVSAAGRKSPKESVCRPRYARHHCSSPARVSACVWLSPSRQTR